MLLTRKGFLCKKLVSNKIPVFVLKFTADFNGPYLAKLYPFVTSGNFKHIQQQQNEMMVSGVCPCA
jgi:hypothetical protein